VAELLRQSKIQHRPIDRRTMDALHPQSHSQPTAQARARSQAAARALQPASVASAGGVWAGRTPLSTELQPAAQALVDKLVTPGMRRSSRQTAEGEGRGRGGDS
jgi:hypothetical protein